MTEPGAVRTQTIMLAEEYRLAFFASHRRRTDRPSTSGRPRASRHEVLVLFLNFYFNAKFKWLKWHADRDWVWRFLWRTRFIR
jgi:hypothetical protein